MVRPFGLSATLCVILATRGLAAEPSLEHWQRLTPPSVSAGPIISTGGQPRGDADFAWLAKLGVKTVVSVDGATPDAETAARHGIRTVHLPIGYDGVPDATQWALTRLISETKQPIYIHCHHGKHRGPAAATIACLAAGQLDVTGAERVLRRAGTDPRYEGLWRDVRGYRRPPPGANVPELVAAADVDPLTASMVTIEQAMTRLLTASTDPANSNRVADAILIQEGFTEAVRATTSSDSRMHRWMKDAADDAKAWVTSIEQNEPRSATARGRVVEQSCVRCHDAYRK